MSTSKRKDIAQTFASATGTVVSFSTWKLPDHVPFVLINDKIQDYMQEDEVLLLPGTIELNGTKGKYNVDKAVYTYMSTLNHTHSGGDPTLDLTIPDIDLRGKYVVFWRAIKHRPVEILSIICLPHKSHKEVLKFWKSCIDVRDREYEDMCRYIPRYKDLFDKSAMTRTQEEREELNSYTVYMAIYDKKQDRIEHYHYGIYDEIAKEIGYDSKHEKDLSQMIKTHWLPPSRYKKMKMLQTFSLS